MGIYEENMWSVSMYFGANFGTLEYSSPVSAEKLKL